MIARLHLDNIKKQLDNPDLPRGVILYGPRQVGKTTLTEQIKANSSHNPLTISGDDRDSATKILESCAWSQISPLIAGHDLIIIDEAQRIKDIGLAAKLILDNYKQAKLILTGSSALDLASRVSEPLTGRAYSYKLWPVSLTELNADLPYSTILNNLQNHVIYGGYPKLLTLNNLNDKRDYLLELTDKYLYKDMLDFGGIKNAPKVKDLLKLLAYQVGSLISVSELATQLEISRDAVNNYLNLLEASFIIFRLSGYGHNLRNEMKKMKKVYFWDTGIRNAIINNFEYKNTRGDWGQIWENFIISERHKKSEYNRLATNYHYWRLRTGTELDLVEVNGESVRGIEIKSNSKLPKAPPTWENAYQSADYQLINADNWHKFIL